VELARELEIQRRLGDVRGLDHPVEPVLVLRRGAGLDVLERGLLTERLQLDHRRVESHECVVRPRGDDQRQMLPLGRAEGDADLIVALGAALRIGVPARLLPVTRQRLLERVGEHDDLVGVAQFAPGALRLGV